MNTNRGSLHGVLNLKPEDKYKFEDKRYTWIEVLVDCPGVTKLFTYSVPQKLQIKPGDIVSVPFGAQILCGIAIRLLCELPTDVSTAKVRNVENIVSSGFFTQAYWELLNRIAEYYYTPLMQVIKVALPPGLLGKTQRRIRLLQRDINSVTFPCHSEIARRILDLLRLQTSGDYSFIYLQRQVQGAEKGVRELLVKGLVESYLETPKSSKPRLQKAAILLKNNFANDVTPRQQEVLQILQQLGGDMWQTELLRTCNISISVLKSLVSKGYISLQSREVLQNKLLDKESKIEPAKLLTPAQASVLSTLRELDGFTIALLHGVTGSGKTEVYLQVVAPLLIEGKSVLILVPEIGLITQIVDRFRARFGNKIVVYHSALSPGERLDSWKTMLTVEAHIVVGTRSAVFSPLSNLGLIIIDEEHDSSFKQDFPMPTYHARTVAQWRAKLENCPLLLGTATPSLEIWLEVRKEYKRKGEYFDFFKGRTDKVQERVKKEKIQEMISSSIDHCYYLSLPQRINSQPLPTIEIVDMRQEIQQGNRSIFSRALQNALCQLQEQRKQGILFINRRGHSTFVSCRSCGYVIECPHCDVSLSYHQTEEDVPKVLRCHYCNYEQAYPPECPKCGSHYLKFFGSGTQRVIKELGNLFPDLRCIRFDSDATRTKGSHHRLLSSFANGEADLLVGTQMLTKGLDFPQVTLVGVVAADGLLHLSDYRASERAFQTLTQVAGRVGRGKELGRVIMQTYTPKHTTIEAVAKYDYHTFVSGELEQRHLLNYPPYGRVVLLRLSGTNPVEVEHVSQKIAEAIPQGEGLDILGPSPASILRVANRYRWQIMLKFLSDSLPNLPNWSDIRKLCSPSITLTIDVDPLHIM